MNAQPHTHRIEIEREYSNGSGGWCIKYGDTRVHMINWIHFLNKKGALKRKVKKAIRQHDRGTVRAGKKAQMVASIQAVHNEVLVEATGNYPYHASKDAWGSELLRESRNAGQEPSKETVSER